MKFNMINLEKIEINQNNQKKLLIKKTMKINYIYKF